MWAWDETHLRVVEGLDDIKNGEVMPGWWYQRGVGVGTWEGID